MEYTVLTQAYYDNTVNLAYGAINYIKG